MTMVFPRDEFIDGLLDQGRAEGEVKGEAKMLLHILAARGLPVSSDIRERILGSTDTAQLEAWADQALCATSITGIFRDA